MAEYANTSKNPVARYLLPFGWLAVLLVALSIAAPFGHADRADDTMLLSYVPAEAGSCSLDN